MGREFQKGNILLLNKHLEGKKLKKKKKNPTTHGGVLIHQESNLFKNLLVKKKKILSVLNVFNKNIEPPHVSNGTGCCHFWCQ